LVINIHNIKIDKEQFQGEYKLRGGKFSAANYTQSVFSLLGFPSMFRILAFSA
jgi:hypothetical protein